MDNNQKTDIFYQVSLEITFIKGCEAIFFFVFAAVDMIGILRKNALLAQFCSAINKKKPKSENLTAIHQHYFEKDLNDILG